MSTDSPQSASHPTLPNSARDPARDHQGSLRSKVVLSLAAMFAVFLVIAEVVRCTVIQPVFTDLEHAAALRDTNRVVAAFNVESDHLRNIAEQSAVRFDPSALLPSKLSNNETGKTASSTWPIAGVEWAAIVGTDQSWRWLHQDELDTQLHTLQQNDDLFQAIECQIDPKTKAPFDGLMCVNRTTIFAYGGAWISSMSANPSSTHYFLVVGTAIDDRAIKNLTRQTQVDFSIQVYRDQVIKKQLRIWPVDASRLVVETPLVGSNDEIMANLFVQVPRDVVQQSRRATAVARNVFVFGAVASLALLLLQIQRIVIGPLKRIREHAERIAEQGLEAGPLAVNSNDEIGELAMTFDHMRSRLSDTQDRLADASHAAGMSQVADTVIHNVGNVLTNVNSLIETAVDRVEDIRVKPLEKLAKRLQGDQSDEALRAATPNYLQKYADALGQDQAELTELLSTLNDNIQHIHGVIRDQRRHTLKKVDKKKFNIQGLLSEAISCSKARLEQENVTVTLPSGCDAEVTSDRSLVLQIVINIIGNARHAMRATDHAQHTLDVSLQKTETSVRIEFRDNGCGMAPEVRERVFEAHFTTRKAGSGLGLHFCAIALKRLGGSISVASDGPGSGSTFTIELPTSANKTIDSSPIIGPVQTPTQIAMNEITS